VYLIILKFILTVFAGVFSFFSLNGLFPYFSYIVGRHQATGWACSRSSGT